MSRYRIQVNVEIVECDDFPSEPMKLQGGSFAMTLSEQNAISIDKCENAILRTAYPTIRDAIAKHLTEVSKKKPMKRVEKEEK